MKSVAVENVSGNDLTQHPVDARVKYPSYKSLDEFVDIERLRALDGYLIERIKRHIKTRREDFFLNLHRLETDAPHQPGVREIWLSRPAPDAPAEAFDALDEAELWQPTVAADEEFVLLTDFIETLPFETTGRRLIIYDDAGKKVPAHRDHLQPEICQEFIWFRTNFNKNLYFLNARTGERRDVEGYTAWFDSVNQYHGSDAGEGLSFSIRVDGKFTEEFRKMIPQSAFNAASTPALWASLD